MEGPGIFSAELSGDYFEWPWVAGCVHPSWPGGLSAHCHTLPQEGSADLWLCVSFGALYCHEAQDVPGL